MNQKYLRIAGVVEIGDYRVSNINQELLQQLLIGEITNQIEKTIQSDPSIMEVTQNQDVLDGNTLYKAEIVIINPTELKDWLDFKEQYDKFLKTR